MPANRFYGIIMIRENIPRLKRIKNAIAERWIFFAVLIIFLFLSFALIKEILNRRQVDMRINEYKNKIELLQKENETLNDKIINFSQSGELEGSVRSKLGMEKPGEHTIIIVRSATSSGQTTIKSNQEVINFNPAVLDGSYSSNPQKWREYFFGQAVK